MAWKKTTIIRENGETVEAQTPQIVSASRSTDIPAFYSDWFFDRLQKGYSAWTNPFNGVKSFISYADTRFIVFWSKNPEPIIKYLPILEEKKINCYIQYTLNDYEDEKLEKGVPSLSKRIDTFKTLVKILGKGKIIWRFDPLLLTKDITITHLLEKVSNIANQLQGITEKLVFSFADIQEYKKVQINFRKNDIEYIDWTEEQMVYFASELIKLNRNWNFQLSTCSERIDFSKYGIEHNSCIDEKLIIRFGYKDAELMKFLGVEEYTPQMSLLGEETIPENAIILPNGNYALTKKKLKDKGQRTACECAVSKDIGEYNTCPHLCEYCYANTSKERAIENYKHYKNSIYAETITGTI